MKKSVFMLAVLLGMVGNVFSQDVTTVEAKNGDISDNLDLEAVATVFGDSEDLQDFERRLNDPESRISNLDLNEDGYVDYLRVIESGKEDVRLITIQAVIGKDLYQDVATIDVEKKDEKTTRVQVVGDVYMYGPGYIIEPVFIHPPLILVYFWGPHYHIWHSPYYWGYYPSYWHFWNPYPVYVYINYIPRHIHTGHVYHYVPRRTSHRCAELNRKARRNDMEVNHPKTSFVDRNEGLTNRAQLLESREAGTLEKPGPTKEVEKDWKTESEKEGRPTKVEDGKVIIERQERPTKEGKEKDVTRSRDNPIDQDPAIQRERKPEREGPSYKKDPVVKPPKVKPPKVKPPKVKPRPKKEKVPKTKESRKTNSSDSQSKGK